MSPEASGNREMKLDPAEPAIKRRAGTYAYTGRTFSVTGFVRGRIPSVFYRSWKRHEYSGGMEKKGEMDRRSHHLRRHDDHSRHS